MDSFGRLPASDVHVSPKSTVFQMNGRKSSLRRPVTVTYAVPAFARDASTRLTQKPGWPGILSRTLVQVPPPFRDTCTLPSSVPTQSRPGTIGDSSIVVIVA